MTLPPPFSNEPSLRERAERNLGSLVIAIEFTLISVMVGVILFPLMEFATPILRGLEFEYMPYILSGLFLILYVWTEVISHSLSFIGWPIDILHNLFYIIFAMVLAIQMHFLSDPQAWFAMTVLSAAVGFAIVYYDQKVIEQRREHSTGEAARLYDTAWQHQHGLVRTAPFNLLTSLVLAGLVFAFPVIFIEYKAHLILIALQIAAFTYLISRTIAHFKATREQNVAKAVEELADEKNGN
jgi:hypothetical protein